MDDPIYGSVWNTAATLTFGDRAENHKGMQIIGQAADAGFTLDDLIRAQEWFTASHIKTIIYDLRELLLEDDREWAVPAYILLADNGASVLVNVDALMTEQERLPKDTQAFMYGKVVNKHARHNLCFGDSAQIADYQRGQGTVVAFQSVPYLNALRQGLSQVVGPTAQNLCTEGNYYHDLKNCGIGYHGDSERKKVIAVRLGAHIPLCYQWYYQGYPVGLRADLLLGHGDLYMMSDKAVGHDWRRKVVLTLRHAAGADKYIIYPVMDQIIPGIVNTLRTIQQKVDYDAGRTI
jgi:hypothetical protein